MDRVKNLMLKSATVLALTTNILNADGVKETTTTLCSQLILDWDTIELKNNKWKVEISSWKKIVFEIRNKILRVTIPLNNWEEAYKYDRIVNPVWTDYCLLFDWDNKPTKEDFLK